MDPDYRRNKGTKREMHRSVEGSADLVSAGNAESIAAATIAALSTPIGEGAISLVRMSGADAVAIVGNIFRGKEKPSRFESHVQHFGEIVDHSGQSIDEVMISVHRAPASYTGEDVVEISCH